MDQNKLNNAIAMLQAFEQELPPSTDIKESYVTLYHQVLTDIQNETGYDLAYFRIPENEIRHHVTPRGRSRYPTRIDFNAPQGPKISEHRYCERARFLMALRGALNALGALSEPKSRSIGF